MNSINEYAVYSSINEVRSGKKKKVEYGLAVTQEERERRFEKDGRCETDFAY